MSTTSQNQNRRLSTSSSLAKRSASSAAVLSENVVGKASFHQQQCQQQPMAKRRPALANVTNQRGNLTSNHNSNSSNSRSFLSESSKLVPCKTKVISTKNGVSTSIKNDRLSGSSSVPASSFVTPSIPASSKYAIAPKEDAPLSTVTTSSCCMNLYPTESDGLSESMDESTSTCDSLKSPEVEYLDNTEAAVTVDSIEKKTSSKLFITDLIEPSGIICKRDILSNVVSDEEIVDVDNDLMDPQACATIACDIYKHLRASEAKKRPSTDFMEKVQTDINASMRAILIDWLVEVSEEYRLVPETLYLTVNYIDRYLSGNLMDRQRLQLLGVACMMIASKYEEICAPQVEEFCYITDNTYFKDEVLQMESDVLNYLKFEMTAPTTKCFLRRFVRAAQGTAVHEVLSMQLECLANYIAELSLLEYTMLCYTPSLIAASAIFLAKFILWPSKRPWNSTLRHYTLYQPSDLRECVMALHSLCYNCFNSTLPAIREKYSQHKYKFVAKKNCPSSIPLEFFQDDGNCC